LFRGDDPNMVGEETWIFIYMTFTHETSICVQW
jgi:hypothetical protein